MATDDDRSPTTPIADDGRSWLIITTCHIQHCFDLDEALSFPTDIARQVAESNSLVDSLPAAAAPSTGDHPPCPICREGFLPEDEDTGGGGGGDGKRVPCGHVYHAACISSWLSDSGGGSCPLCRRSISAVHEQK